MDAHRQVALQKGCLGFHAALQCPSAGTAAAPRPRLGSLYIFAVRAMTVLSQEVLGMFLSS